MVLEERLLLTKRWEARTTAALRSRRLGRFLVSDILPAATTGTVAPVFAP
jgi:hypothetical protein